MKCSADMRDVKVSSISDLVCNLCIKANTVLETNVVEAMNEALSEERSPIGREIIGELIENAEIASKNSIAMCQDTGISVVYVEIGHDVHLVGGDLYEAINEGVRRGYTCLLYTSIRRLKRHKERREGSVGHEKSRCTLSGRNLLHHKPCTHWVVVYIICKTA